MLDLEESSLAECQQYLLSLADPDAPALGENLSERDLSEVITQCKTWQNIEFSADERTIIPKYVARILSTILNATSLEGKTPSLELPSHAITNLPDS